MPNETRLDVAKPGPLAINASRVRTNNAAPTTRIKVKAICAVTITFRSRTPPNAVPPRSRSDDTSERRPACQAGARPLKTPAATLAPKREEQQSASRRPRAKRVARGASRGRNAIRVRTASGAATAPEQSTGKRDQQAVGKKLPSESPARSAQRQPCADLTIASRSTRQEQTGDIQTGQTQQHRRHRE